MKTLFPSLFGLNPIGKRKNSELYVARFSYRVLS